MILVNWKHVRILRLFAGTKAPESRRGVTVFDFYMETKKVDFATDRAGAEARRLITPSILPFIKERCGTAGNDRIARRIFRRTDARLLLAPIIYPSSTSFPDVACRAGVRDLAAARFYAEHAGSGTL